MPDHASPTVDAPPPAALQPPSFLKPFLSVGALTLLSRLLGFIRDAGAAALLGTGAAGTAFAVAMLVPTIARRLLADGAVAAALTPALAAASPQRNRPEFAAMLGLTLVTLGLVTVMAPVWSNGVAALLGAALAPTVRDEAAWLLLLAAPYLLTGSLAAVYLAGALAAGRARAVAAAPVLLNAGLLIGLAVAIGAADPGARAEALALSLPCAGLLQLGFAAALAHASGYSPWPRWPRRTRWRLEGLARLAASLAAHAAPLLCLGATMAAAGARGGSGIAALYFAERLLALPIGVIGAAIGGLMATAAGASAASGVAGELGSPRPGSSQSGASDGGARTLADGLRLGALLALPAAAGLALLATPIVEALFGRGAFDDAAIAETAAILAGAAPAAALFVLGRVQMTALIGKQRSPAAAAAGLVAAALSGMAALNLPPEFGPLGLGLGVSLGALAACVLCALTDPDFNAALVQIRTAVAKIAAACLAMSALLLLVAQLPAVAEIATHALQLLLLIPLGVAGYGLALVALRFPLRAALGRGGGGK